MKLATRLKHWAAGLKCEALVLYFAMRDPRTPWAARLLAALTVAHTFSPIDLIPDFIPVLGCSTTWRSRRSGFGWPCA